MFTGVIPPEVAQLKNLVALELDHNLLTGTIPPELGQMTQLQTLHLQYNSLDGTVPASLAQLQNMTSFFANNNHLTGPLPPAFEDYICNHFGNTSQGLQCSMHDNRFTTKDCAVYKCANTNCMLC